MPLQASGPISISQIRTELLKRNTNSYSLRTLSSSAGKTSPDAMSELYSFNGCFPSGTFYQQICSGTNLYNLYRDGSCTADGGVLGLYNTMAQYCAPQCGAPTGCTPAGTVLNEYCGCYVCYQLGNCDAYNYYPYSSVAQKADGCCGIYYEMTQEINDACTGYYGYCCFIQGVNCP
jgi:hypothetical protein